MNLGFTEIHDFNGPIFWLFIEGHFRAGTYLSSTLPQKPIQSLICSLGLIG
jgi:hypothetical protein